MLMSRLRTDRQTDGNVKVEQYAAEAESAIKVPMQCNFQKKKSKK